jgi:predicted nucleic acid-binding protein
MVRHLTGDPPEQAARATRLLSQAGQLLLPDLIVAEVVYVLESFYEVPRPRVAEPVRERVPPSAGSRPSRTWAGGGSARPRS